MRKERHSIVRHKFLWLFWSFFILAVWFIGGHLPQLREIIKTFFEGQWEFILLAIIIQCAYYVLNTFMIISAFDVVEIKNHFKELVFVVLSGNFVNVVAPVGGAGSAALYVDDAVRRGYPIGRATAGTILALISDFCASASILVIGLVILFEGNRITVYEEIAALVFLLIVVALIALIIIARFAPKLLSKIMIFGEKIIHNVASVFKKDPFEKGWAERTTTDFSEASHGVTKHPYKMLRAVLFGLVAYSFEIVGLFMIFLAFHQPVTFQTLLVGYAVAGLFWKISITPQGIGVVEAAMTLVYTQLGIPVVTATLIALTFRGITFWLPFFAGFLTFRKMRMFEHVD
jgi:uncharacterized protein (TIRG00374 family)